MNNYIHSAIGILAVINPFVCGAMILQMDGQFSNKTKVANSIKAMTAVFIILLISAVLGKSILGMFGISMDAFKAVGGIILSIIGFNMMIGSKNDAASEKSKSGLMPMIFFAASPGTISMVITLSVANNKEGFPITTIVGTLIAIIITVAVIIFMILTSRKKKDGGQGILSKYMGLIIVAMGLQFMLDGIKHFFQL